MSRTISFVVTEELGEWLDEESNRRMTTVSSTAQQLLAELYREELGENERSRDGGGKNIFDKYPSKWARPDSNIYEYRVESPDGTTRYYKSREGAANQLRVEYD